jgi:signal transduction histidine kinase
MKTLKGKITFVYLFLVIITAVVGIASVANLYTLSRSINGLMVDNYKSIDAANRMVGALEDEDIAVLNYIYKDDPASLDKFYESESEFYRWYNVEINNYTEPGEKDITLQISKYYLKYQSLLAQVEKINDTEGDSAAIKFYNTSLVPSFITLRNEVKKLSSLNEDAMFNNKDRVTSDATNSMYLIMILSVSAILIGFFVSSKFTDKFLKPLYILKQNIEAIREGHLGEQTEIISNDEIGQLAFEFNKMTYRLKNFERSTKGKLMEEKNKSVAIVKSISDPLVVLNTDYKISLMNHACETFFNIDERNSINKHFLDVFKNSDLYDLIVNEFNSKDDKYTPKIISITNNDKEFYFDTLVTKVKDDDSLVRGVVVIFQNVTKLKKLEKVKSDFISTISHELKTPLTSIMMGTSLMKNAAIGELNEKQEEILKTIEDDSERLSSLVSNLLQLSKIQSDRAIYHFEPCSILGIVENSMKTFTELAQNKEVNLYSNIDEDLPKIIADHEKITWVLNNLISNALRYTNAGDDISINAKVVDKMMQISVKDTGAGIPEEYMDKLFDKSARINSNEFDLSSSSGLGLVIAKDIVEVHKCTIWCESELDVGSTFYFTIPLAL